MKQKFYVPHYWTQKNIKNDVFKELYHFIWNEEEAYKLLKASIEVECFLGKAALSVKQDFHAKILHMPLTAAFAHPLEQNVKEEFKADEKRKFNQKIYKTNALAKAKNSLINLFLKELFQKTIIAFDNIVFNTRESVRLGRGVPRKHSVKKRYSTNYKTL